MLGRQVSKGAGLARDSPSQLLEVTTAPKAGSQRRSQIPPARC